jgi:hypothetical protein
MAAAQAKDLQGPADALGVRLTVVGMSNAIDLEEAFASLVRERIEALQLGVDPLFGTTSTKSSPWRHAARYRQSIRGTNLPRPAV